MTVPQGYPATMGVGAGLRFVLSHDDGIDYRFYANGYADQIIDAGGDTITFGYVTNAAGEWEMTSLTDSQAGVVSFERSAPTKVVRVVDPAGRSHRYGYGADTFGNVVLTTYTDPAGAITRYSYEGRAVLKTITDPSGAVTTFTSDADQRLTSLTRAGQTWRFDYSTPWRTTVTDPPGNVTTHSFNRRGQVTTSSGPPYAPTGVRAVPGDGQAALSWGAAEPNGSPVSGYTLTASPGGATMTVVGDVTSAMFEGLANGTAYTFTAMATNGVGNSLTSAPSNQVTPSSDASLLAPLLTPTNVVATRGDTEAHVSWSEPTLTLPLLTNYEVTTHRASDGFELSTTSAGTDSNLTVTGLKNGTPVYFTVTARTLVIAATSQPSNTVTPAGPPFAPAGLWAERGDQRLDLTWDAPSPRPDGTPGDNGDPITSYTVTVFRAEDNAVIETIEGAASPQEVDGLTNGTTYYFTVRATNGVGTGPESATSNFVAPAGRPFSPSNVGAMVRNTDARIIWSQPDDNGSPITGYTVIVSDGRRQTVPAGVTSTSIIGLEEGISYTFTVVATSDVGDSDPSTPSNTVTVTKIPGVPGSPTAAAGVGSAMVTWTPADPNGAQVLYYTISTDEGHLVTAPGSATSVTVPNVAPGSFHSFFIFATNMVGNGPTTVTNAVQIPASPDAPFRVSAYAREEAVELRWIAPSSGGSAITGYTITATPSGAQTFVPNTFEPGQYPSTTLSGLDPAITYTFTVVANNVAGDGPTSEPSNAVRPLTEREALRQQADSYMTRPLDEFLAAADQAPAPFNWDQDGCSFPPEVFYPDAFLDACHRHDFGYRNYGKGLSLSPTEDTRHWIDDVLLLDWLDTCGGETGCVRLASDLYIGLRLCGQDAFTSDGPLFCPTVG